MSYCHRRRLVRATLHRDLTSSEGASAPLRYCDQISLAAGNGRDAAGETHRAGRLLGIATTRERQQKAIINEDKPKPSYITKTGDFRIDSPQNPFLA